MPDQNIGFPTKAAVRRPETDVDFTGHSASDPRLPGALLMGAQPALSALDSDHDGVITRAEIAGATASLRTLDRNGDGSLEIRELLPSPLTNEVNLVLRHDTEFEGKIVLAKSSSQLYHELLNAADRNRDKIVTRDELELELMLRMDSNRDGILTWEEVARYKSTR